MKSKLSKTQQLGMVASGLVAMISLWPPCTSAKAPGENIEESRPLSVATASNVTGDEIFRELVEHSQQRDLALQRYSVVRTYQVSSPKGRVYGQEVVDVSYSAPGSKTFVTKSEQGSWLVRHLVLNRLMESEEETASGQDRRDSSISPRNYSFKLLGEERVGPFECYVVEASPKREDKYLFVGKIWISKQDFGIVRIAGQPARKLSFWIDRVDFVRQYEKIGEFWLPERDETIAKVRLKGKHILTIVHADYIVNGPQATHEQSQDTSQISPRVDPGL